MENLPKAPILEIDVEQIICPPSETIRPGGGL